MSPLNNLRSLQCLCPLVQVPSPKFQVPNLQSFAKTCRFGPSPTVAQSPPSFAVSSYTLTPCLRLVNVLGSNQWSEDVVPTVAFNLRQVRKGNVTMKVWDVAVSRGSTTKSGFRASLVRLGAPVF